MRAFLIFILLATFSITNGDPNKHSTTVAKTVDASVPYSVGTLGKKWEFPSDHLPVGVSIGNVHAVMWNILYKNAIHRIESNTQGLKESFITAANILDDDGLTLRESVIIDEIFEMIGHPSHPRSVIALEDCALEVYVALTKQLPNHVKLFPENAKDLAQGNVFIYDTKRFDLISAKMTRYQSKPSNTYQQLKLVEKTSGLSYCFIQSHLPGGSISECDASLIELANAALSAYNQETITILFGDMNCSPADFKNYLDDSLLKTQEDTGFGDTGFAIQPFFHMPIPYPTHINTKKQAVWVDNIFVANPFDKEMPTEVSSGPMLFYDLLRTIDLLESLKR